MSAVFADTFYFLALTNPRDRAHAKCVAMSEALSRPIVTTTWVLMELGDALCRGTDRALFSLLVEDLAGDAETTVLTANQELFVKAVALFDKRPDKGWSLTDCTSFIAMQEKELTDALTSDRHFQQAGFNALLVD